MKLQTYLRWTYADGPMPPTPRRLSDLEARASDYRRFLPEWPALWKSFERDAQVMREQLKKGKP